MSLSLIVIVLFYLQVQGLHPTKISLNTDLTHEPRLQRSWKQSRQETVNLVDKTIDPRHKQLTVGGAWWPLVCLLGVELLWKSECEWFYIGTMFCFVFFGYHVPHSSFFVFLAHVFLCHRVGCSDPDVWCVQLCLQQKFFFAISAEIHRKSYYIEWCNAGAKYH